MAVVTADRFEVMCSICLLFKCDSSLQEIFLTAIGEHNFDAKRTSLAALRNSLSLNHTNFKKPDVARETLKQEDRLTVERYILGLVFKVCCEAKDCDTLMLDYSHPLSNSVPVLPRLLDMVLSFAEDSILEPGFIFTLIQQLVEVAMKAEENLKLIDWIIENKSKLKQEHVLSRGKLIFLRAVNRMLKLLQQGKEHSVYYGRMLFCMSELYTMAERSATNHSGLKDSTHPVIMHPWSRPIYDDFGKPIDKSIYLLYWKLIEHVQGPISNESDASRVMDELSKILDCFKNHPCRQTHISLPITLINNTSPEQFNLIFRDPDCRMECLVQVYVYLQRLLSPMRHPMLLSDSVKQHLVSSQQALVTYILSDSDLKQRWTPIYPCLIQEPTWIDWKNNGAKEWALPPLNDHPWTEKYSHLSDQFTVNEMTEAAQRRDKEMMDMDQKETIEKEDWKMKAAEGLHGQFNRDLELPDLEELRVPTARDFLKDVLEDKEELKSSSEILESDTSFCWRTYRLLSEHDVSHMVNSEHRTNFGKLLQDLDLQNLQDNVSRKPTME